MIDSPNRILGCGVIAILFAFVSLLTIILLLEKSQCYDFHNFTGYETRFSIPVKCEALVGNKWIDVTDEEFAYSDIKEYLP